MKYEWLLFDLDNTLLSFEASEHYALAKVLEKVGLTFQPKYLEIYEKINRACWDAFEAGTLTQSILNETRFSQFLDQLGLPNEDSVALGNHYLIQLSEKVVFMEGAKVLLDAQYLDYNLGIVTNGLKEVQRPKLVKAGLIPYFKIIIVSDEIGMSKPQANFFDFTFQQMGNPPKEKVLIIGDSLNSDIKGGHNYGIDTCWYNPLKKKNSSKIQPTYEIDSLDQLKTLQII